MTLHLYRLRSARNVNPALADDTRTIRAHNTGGAARQFFGQMTVKVQEPKPLTDDCRSYQVVGAGGWILGLIVEKDI